MKEAAHGRNGRVNGENNGVSQIIKGACECETEKIAHEKDANELTLNNLREQLRACNKTILDQSQRIEELESYLACIVNLSAKVKELELEIQSGL
jgi:hypothetical protein